MKIPKLLTSPHDAWLPSAAATVLLGALSAGAADYSSTVLADNPVGYYRFEEPVGTLSLLDSSPMAINATVFPTLDGTGPALGHLGLSTNSIYFNGTAVNGSTAGHYGTVDVPFRQQLSPTNTYGITTVDGYLKGGPFSVECWTRSFVNRTDKYEGIVGVTGPYRSAYTPKWGGWVLGKDTSSRFTFIMRNGSTFAGPVPTLLQWYHLVATFDGTNAAFYVNGVLLGASTNSADNARFVPSNYDGVSRAGNIGNSRYSDNPWYGYNGEVDEVAFYTNALSPDRVQAHYQVGTNSITLPPTPPMVLTDVTNTTGYANRAVTLRVQAGGDLPLAYQWLRGGSPISGATNSTLTFTCLYPDDNGATFSVTVTNRAGSTNSSVATLTVSTDLITAANPEDGSMLLSINRNVGSYAAFRPVAYGAGPIGYQWYRDNALLPGETSATLWLTNVQMADSGASFSVKVTNPWNSTTLTAFLNVQPRAVDVPLIGYAAIVAADRPVAYWRLDDNYGAIATDAVGSFDGAYTDVSSGNGLFTWQLPAGIPGETNVALGITNGAILSLPFAPELNPDQAWSAETWVQPSVLSPDPNFNYVIFSSEYNHSTSSYNDWNGWYLSHGSAHTFNFVPEPGGSATTLSAGPDDPAHNNQIVAGQWYHLVVSRDATNFNLYINGKLRASRPVATTPFIANGTGVRPEDGNQGHGETMIGSLHDRTRTPFAGTVDDTAFYNYALSPKQVLSHYLNSTNIAPPQVSLRLAKYNDKVVLTWPQGTLQSAPAVTGPYTDMSTAVSPYTNTVGASTFFRVKVQ